MHDYDPLARFCREAQVLASLNHPNIATLHGLEETNGLRALMEFVEGRTLVDLIAEARTKHQGRDGGLALPEAVSIARQIASALESAHEHGIIHRDLKPANVIVRDDRHGKGTGFRAGESPGPGKLNVVTNWRARFSK